MGAEVKPTIAASKHLGLGEVEWADAEIRTRVRKSRIFQFPIQKSRGDLYLYKRMMFIIVHNECDGEIDVTIVPYSLAIGVKILSSAEVKNGS